MVSIAGSRKGLCTCRRSRPGVWLRFKGVGQAGAEGGQACEGRWRRATAGREGRGAPGTARGSRHAHQKTLAEFSVVVFFCHGVSWTDSISAIEGEILVRGRSSSKTSPPVPALLVGSGGAINTFMSAFYHPYIYNKLLTTKLLN